MKPNVIFNGKIADMRKQGQAIDYEPAEHNTQAVDHGQVVEGEQAFRPKDGFRTEECLYAGIGIECDSVCVYCDMKHVCLCWNLKRCSFEASIEPPCPLRIPGCRCSTGADPTYICKTGESFVGAYRQGAGDEEILVEELDDEGYFEEKTGEEDVTEGQTEDDGLVQDGSNEDVFNFPRGGGSLEDEHEGEDIVEEGTRKIGNENSLWPLSAAFWKGFVPAWEQGRLLPPPSQLQVDYNENSDFWSESRTIGHQNSVAAGQYAPGTRAQPSMDVLPLPIAFKYPSSFLLGPRQTRNQSLTTASRRKSAANSPIFSKYAEYATAYNGHSTLLPRSPELTNQEFKATSQNATAGGQCRPSQRPAT